MFRISQSDSYFWPVTVNVPVSGGVFKKETFEVEFRRISQSRLKEILADDSFDRVAFAREVVKGWKGVEDGGAELPFSDDALDQLLDVPLVAAAIFDAFAQSISGAKSKN